VIINPGNLINIIGYCGGRLYAVAGPLGRVQGGALCKRPQRTWLYPPFALTDNSCRDREEFANIYLLPNIN
jgi:hypothetical protein